MADKITQQITDALSKAAAEPSGLPLFASKASRDQALRYARGGTVSSYARLDAYLASKR